MNLQFRWHRTVFFAATARETLVTPQRAGILKYFGRNDAILCDRAPPFQRNRRSDEIVIDRD